PQKIVLGFLIYRHIPETVGPGINRHIMTIVIPTQIGFFPGRLHTHASGLGKNRSGLVSRWS
ncbi:MAG: hypothetical protein AAF542_22655, partial [Pseudomonadota bacterium]